jgi:hypothetical protein
MAFRICRAILLRVAHVDATSSTRVPAEGVTAALHVALDQQQLGITAQTYFGAVGYSNEALYGNMAKTPKLWGICVYFCDVTSYVARTSRTANGRCILG